MFACCYANENLFEKCANKETSSHDGYTALL